ncbi:hypothetical protein [Streptomyces sp. RerS4]|uniref:hypothetical protein n=1 Tax=Streptomyces sp. RerS4 TaxID=2942449 RepID=UPI00201C0F3C|nr:hypothetical protein [Streptomyces sp. RerS4]UQX01833.1 hypothetical protein M4D82_15940 [Streptomyces sp. RerS4]
MGGGHRRRFVRDLRFLVVLLRFLIVVWFLVLVVVLLRWRGMRRELTLRGVGPA